MCVVGVYGQNEKYCDPALCTDEDGNVKPHIACPGVQNTSQCPSNVRAVSLDGKLKKLILDKHRYYLAGNYFIGASGYFPSAKQMPTIVS